MDIKSLYPFGLHPHTILHNLFIPRFIVRLKNWLWYIYKAKYLVWMWGIFYRILLVPQNIVMNLNNVSLCQWLKSCAISRGSAIFLGPILPTFKWELGTFNFDGTLNVPFILCAWSTTRLNLTSLSNGAHTCEHQERGLLYTSIPLICPTQNLEIIFTLEVNCLSGFDTRTSFKRPRISVLQVIWISMYNKPLGS